MLVAALPTKGVDKGAELEMLPSCKDRDPLQWHQLSLLKAI